MWDLLILVINTVIIIDLDGLNLNLITMHYTAKCCFNVTLILDNCCSKLKKSVTFDMSLT